MKFIIYPLCILSGIYLSANLLYQVTHLKSDDSLNKHIEKVVQVQLNRQSSSQCQIQSMNADGAVGFNRCEQSC